MSLFWAHVIAFDVLIWLVIGAAVWGYYSGRCRKAADDIRMKRHVEDR